MKTTKGEQAKQCLIETAAKLFLKNGYSNTGINDILRETNSSKGAFYFYFSSKKELGMEVAKYYGRELILNWLGPLSNNSWEVFVNKLTSDLKSAESKGEYFGCPIAVLGLETAFIEEDLSKVYAEAIKKLIDVFSKSIQVSGIEKDKSDLIARKAFTVYEGYIVYYRVSKDEKIFDFMRNDLLELI